MPLLTIEINRDPTWLVTPKLSLTYYWHWLQNSVWIFNYSENFVQPRKKCLICKTDLTFLPFNYSINSQYKDGVLFSAFVQICSLQISFKNQSTSFYIKKNKQIWACFTLLNSKCCYNVNRISLKTVSKHKSSKQEKKAHNMQNNNNAVMTITVLTQWRYPRLTHTSLSDVPHMPHDLHSMHCHGYFLTDIIMFGVNWRQLGCPKHPHTHTH